MDLVGLFSVWLTLFSISFTLMPLFVVLEWKKRQSAEGFSSVNLVLPVLIMSCWFRHGLLANDPVNICINGISLSASAFYIAAFWFYQPKRNALYGQLAAVAVTIFALFQYVASKAEEERADTMGAIAAGAQIASLAGAVYDLKRAVDLKTMEYVPAQMQFGFLALILQWLLFALLTRNFYMAIANLAGLSLNLGTFALYALYPPKTWRVPLLGVGGEEIGKSD